MTQPRHGRHRQTGPLSRFLQRTGSTLLVIVTLAAGSLVIGFTPDTDARERPFLASGAPGERVETRLFEVTVLRARVASVIKVGGWKHPTQGRWVILRIRLVARHEALAVAYAAIHDAEGRSFRASDRLRQPLIDGSRTLQPGIAVEGEVAFEIPKDATGLSARFAADSTSHRMDSMSDIDLPIGDSAVWLDPEPVRIDEIEVKP